MAFLLRALFSVCLCIVVWWATLSSASRGQDIWSGLTKSFTKVGGTDYSLPENQDAITENVVLTRGDTGGLFNFSSESGYTSSYSPEFTEWATDISSPGQTIAASNWSNLVFDDWLSAYGGPLSMGSGIANRDAVVHLIFEDVYLDLRFTSWGVGVGGGFSYMRAEPPGPGPTGDYNGNNIVDAADYTIWRDTLGSTTDLRANGDDTGLSAGKIDDADYVFWKAHFGEVVPMGAGGQSTAVPEPSIATMVFAGLICCFSFPLRRASPGKYPARRL